MALREFAHLTDRLLAHLGEEAVLRGDTNTAVGVRANVEHGVEFADPDGQAIFERSVATISKLYSPEVGDTLYVFTDGGRFRLDRMLADNGHSRRFVLLGI